MHSDANNTIKRPSPRAEILNLPVYKQGKSLLAGVEAVVKLSSNESPFGPSPAAIAAYQSLATSLYRYPDGSQAQLKQAIAEVHGLDVERIICGNGSDELLDLAYRAYLAPGDEIILSCNHFSMCAIYAKIQGATLVIAEETNYLTSVEDLLSKVSDRTRMVTLANPNNPTGTCLNSRQLREIHAGLPAGVLLVIDGAYAEYVTQDDYESGTQLVDEYENVLLTRTFSKIYGLSALRIGWAYGPAHVIDVLQRIRSPFNTNSAAMAAAAAAVRDVAYIENIRQHTARWIIRLSRNLRELGITVVSSAANFYLLDFSTCKDKSASGAQHWLEARGIIPRAMKTGEGVEVLRITVGLDSENEAVLAALTDYMS